MQSEDAKVETVVERKVKPVGELFVFDARALSYEFEELTGLFCIRQVIEW